MYYRSQSRAIPEWWQVMGITGRRNMHAQWNWGFSCTWLGGGMGISNFHPLLKIFPQFAWGKKWNFILRVQASLYTVSFPHVLLVLYLPGDGTGLEHFFSFSPYHNISLCLYKVCMQPLQPKEKSVCHDIPSVWRPRQSLGKVSHFPVFPAYCWFSITLLLDAPEKTIRTSLLVGFHHFCLKMKLTKMKNSWIKKKSSKQISKQIQTFKN